MGQTKWNRNEGNRHNWKNPHGQAHKISAGWGFGRGSHIGGRRTDINKSGVRGARGGSGNNTKPPHQGGQR